MAETDLEALHLRNIITAGWRTRLISEGVQSGLIDALQSQPQSAAAIATKLGLNEEAVFRVLRALATFGIAAHVGPRDFTSTALGSRLRSDAPNSMRGIALHWGGRLMASLETIGHTLRTGEPGKGGGNFAALIADPVQSDIFYRSMAEGSKPVAKALAETIDFSRFGTVMDVGGGYGAVLAEILRANSAVGGIVYDLGGIEAGARRYLDESGVGERARFVAGSFFESVPAIADCIVLKYILHDWSDPEVATIMASCRAALKPGDTVVIVEKLLPEQVGEEDESVVRSDLIMMPINGKERTLAEYKAVAASAGFAWKSDAALVDECFAFEIEAI